MTRALVCGAAVFDDANFVHKALNEVNLTYGPISCVVHSNHQPALMWQQWVARKQDIKHRPITFNPRDGVDKHARCRDRLFDEGRPDIVVTFEVADGRDNDRDEMTKLITLRALERGIIVVPFVYSVASARVTARRTAESV